MAIKIARRKFISVLGGAAAAWPLTARAQQTAMPVIGFLAPWARGDSPQLLAAFHQGLSDAGFVDGQNVAIEYRLAELKNERLPALAADLVHRQVAVIAAAATPAALAAKAATTTIPVVFEIGGDPVQLGLVATLNRPGGNVTGVTNFNTLVAPKRLELLHELLPTVRVMVLLVNPTNPSVETQSSDVLPAAHDLGLELHVLTASAESDFDAVFAKLTQLRAGGLVISADPFFTAREEQLAALAVRYAVPTVYENRRFVAAGGLVSYGGSQSESYRLTGGYVARILKGEQPAELPVQQSTKVEMFLNVKAAKALGITFPITLLGRADEVIRRRGFIALLGSMTLGWPRAARAQRATGKIARIGIIDGSPSWDPFREQLRKLNYVEGQNLSYVYLRTDGSPAQLDAAAAALAQVPVNVIVAFGTPRAQAAQRATKTIPIVAISISDPITAGLVTSLGHPDGNITGNTILGPDVVTKKLQILKDALPAVTRVAYVWNPDNSATAEILEDLRKVAPLFHMTLISLEARTTVDFDRVFAQMSSDPPDAVLTTSDPLHQAHMPAVIDFLLKNRIAGLFQVREDVVAGGLMSYGVSLSDLFRMGALYTDKILRGTKPEDLPIAQPVTFEFVINLKTAKAIGLEIPTTVIARADEVIE